MCFHFPLTDRFPEVVDYFQATVSLYQSLPSYDWLSQRGIVPSHTQTYTLTQIQEALQLQHGKPVTIGCHRGALDEIWYYFDVKGSVQTGEFIPALPDGAKGSCPATGIKYLPKGQSVAPTATRSTAVPSPTSTGPPFTGKGHLIVRTGGAQKGCIIGSGKWYTSGTCATFTSTQSGDDFTLASRKGECAIVRGALTCAPSITHASVFSGDGTTLSIGGNATFYADKIPHGWNQGTVYVAEDGHATDLEIVWQSA